MILAIDEGTTGCTCDDEAGRFVPGEGSTAAELSRALAVHRDALSECRKCTSGHMTARPIVSLARTPRVILVGQAPGKTEIVARTPFAGRAGRTLFRWLAGAGLAEEDARRLIYIAAVTRCYPGAHPSGRGDRVPSRIEQDSCSTWLDAELRLIRPRLVIPVGGLAIRRFLAAAPLEALVGREHTVEYPGGRVSVIPLPHPSGASSWIHAPGHRELVDRAIALLSERFRALRLTSAACVLVLTLLATPTEIQGQAREPDRWLGADKAKHFIISSFVYSVSYSTLQLLRVDDPSRTTGAALGAAIAGVGKEFIDRRRGSRFSPKDLVWDGAGAILAGLLMKHTRR